MSDVFTKRRPMIDLDEFERRLCRSCSTDQKDDDPLAELLRIIGVVKTSLMRPISNQIPPLSARAR